MSVSLLPWRGRRRCRDSTEMLQFVHSSMFGTARANSGMLHSILYLEEKSDSNDFHAKQSLHTTMNIDVEETNTISSLLLRF